MSNLVINKRQIEGVVIVDIEGKIALGDTNRQLHEAVRTLVNERKKNVVLNLAKVTGIDSCGLGELIASYATIENSGGNLKLINIPPKVTEIMTLTKLVTVFDVFDNEADAIASFDTQDAINTQDLNDGKASKTAAEGSLL
jgi:anti-sigma B factor antagonist